MLHGGSVGSRLGRSESKRPFSKRTWRGMSSGGANSQDWWVTGRIGMFASAGSGQERGGDLTRRPS